MKPDYEWAWTTFYKDIAIKWPTNGPHVQRIMDDYINPQEIKPKEAPKMMRVECAIAQVRCNDKLAMRRIHWTNTVVRFKNGELKIYKIKEGCYQSFTLTGPGLSSEDWIVEPVPTKFHSGIDAIKALLKGKLICRFPQNYWYQLNSLQSIPVADLKQNDWLIKED